MWVKLKACLTFLSIMWTPCLGLTLGIQASSGAASAIAQWNLTASYFSQALNQSVLIEPYVSDQDFAASHAEGKLDIIIAGPSLITCMKVLKPLTLLGTLVLNQSNTLTTNSAGIIFTHINNTKLNRVTDILDHTVSTGPVTYLSAFQSQLGYLYENSVSIFASSAGIFVSPDLSSPVLDVISKRFDVGFTSAPQLTTMQNQGTIQAGSIKVLDAKTFSGYPYTTTTPLYPALQVAASQTLNESLILNLSQLLFAPSPAAAAAAGFVRIAPPYEIFQLLQLQIALGIQQPPFRQCQNTTNLANAVQCPPGQIKRDSTCRTQEFSCPANYTCICRPCMSPEKRIGKLKLKDFLIVILVPLLLSISVGCFIGIHLWVNHVPSLKGHEVKQHTDIVTVTQIGPVKSAKIRGLAAIVSRVPCRRPFIWHLTMLRDARVENEKKANARAELQHKHLMPALGLCRDQEVQVFLGGERGTLQHLLDNPHIKMDAFLCVKLMWGIAEAMLMLQTQNLPGLRVRCFNIFLGNFCRPLLMADTTEPNVHDAWQPPEVLQGEGRCFAGDSYTMAMIMYQVLHRRQPFVDEKQEDVLEMVADTQVCEAQHYRPTVQRTYDLDLLYDTMIDAWNTNKEQRPTMGNIRATLHQYFGRLHSSKGTYISNNSASEDHVLNVRHAAVFILMTNETSANYMAESLVKQENILILPAVIPNMLIAISYEPNACSILAHAAKKVMQKSWSSALHYGIVTRASVPLADAVTCYLGPAIPTTHQVLKSAEANSLLVTSAAVDRLSAEKFKGVFRRRPGHVKHVGYEELTCFWLN